VRLRQAKDQPALLSNDDAAAADDDVAVCPECTKLAYADVYIFIFHLRHAFAFLLPVNNLTKRFTPVLQLFA